MATTSAEDNVTTEPVTTPIAELITFKKVLTDDTYFLLSPWAEVTYIFIIMCVGFAGNTMIIASVLFNKALRNITNAFIVNAAVSDLIVVVVVFPSVISNIIQDGQSVSDAACHFLSWTLVFSFATSVNTFQVLAFTRYIHICWPSVYGKIFNKKVVIALIVYIWMCILPIKGGFILGHLEKSYYVNFLRVCFVYTETHPVDAVFCISFTMFAALTAMFCYLRIIHHIYSSSKKMKQHKGDAPKKSWKQDKEFQATIALLTALFMFMICYLPFSICHLIDAIVPQSRLLLRGLWFINLLNFVANGIVYGILNRQFRRAYRQMLCFCIPKNKVMDSSATSSSGTASSSNGAVTSTKNTQETHVPESKEAPKF